MIQFSDPVTQAQYERLRAEPCTPSDLGVMLAAHQLVSKDVRVSWFRRAKKPHWRCLRCSLDEPRVKGVCMTACAGMCSYPKCLGEG